MEAAYFYSASVKKVAEFASSAYVITRP